MKFVKEKNMYIARGSIGTFYIKKSQGLFWASYQGNFKSFKLPPKQKISEAKALCMENYFWEEPIKIETPKIKFSEVKTHSVFEEKGEQLKLL